MAEKTELELALEHDAARKLAEGARPTAPQAVHHTRTDAPARPPGSFDPPETKPPAPPLFSSDIPGDPPKRPSINLPDGMKQVLWVPEKHGDDWYFKCRVEGFGHVAQAHSRNKMSALAFALEEMAQKIREEGARLV